jgi:hypothetical protein
MTRRLRSLLVALAVLALSPARPAASLGQQVPAPPPPAARPAEPPAAVPADPRAQLTETVGLVSGLYLYQTYLTIGLLADGKAERVYDEKAARGVLATVVTPLDAVDKQVARVGELAQTPADRQAAERLRVVIGLLRQQGRDLVAVWDGGGHPALGAKYEATRQEAWKQINALLGLDRR